MERVCLSPDDLRSLFWSFWLMFAFSVLVGLFMYDLLNFLARRILSSIRAKLGISRKDDI